MCVSLRILDQKDNLGIEIFSQLHAIFRKIFDKLFHNLHCCQNAECDTQK